MNKTFLHSLKCEKCNIEVALLNPTDHKVERRCECGHFEVEVQPQTISYTEDEYEEYRAKSLEDHALVVATRELANAESIPTPTGALYCGDCGDVVQAEVIVVGETGDTELKNFGCSCGCHEGEKYEEKAK